VAGSHPDAPVLAEFFGGPTGHRLWAESEAGFTMTSGTTHAEAFKWVADNRVAHTYRLTARRMLRECGDIREGLCIDIGCGTGLLNVELARQSNLTIIGLDIDPDMEPLFDRTIRDAGFSERVRFVEGDAQQLPFPDDYADMIVSRGTLTFIPDIGKCLREVRRVLKPKGTAFLGGRYLYTPQEHKISTEILEQIVRDSGVPDARVIDERGQWVKIAGPESPVAVRQDAGGPPMLVDRLIADYAILEGRCLLVCGSDRSSRDLLQGLLEETGLKVAALYPKEEETSKARMRIEADGLAERVTCRTGNIQALPFDDAAFDLVVGTGPFLLWGEREKGMKEVYRVLRDGGAALIGGRFLHMPQHRKVSSETLRHSAAQTGIPSIRVIDDMGQWVELRKGIGQRKFRD
jgi:ubiquinone/menaquinone biosynthesis C-methylase UbiE